MGDLWAEVRPGPGPLDPGREFNKGAGEFQQVNERSSFRTTPRASSWQSGKAHREKSGESVHSITMPCAQINKREKESSCQLIESLVGTGKWSRSTQMEESSGPTKEAALGRTPPNQQGGTSLSGG